MHFVDADGVISRPLAIIQTLAKGESSFVKCSSNRQDGLVRISPVLIFPLNPCVRRGKKKSLPQGTQRFTEEFRGNSDAGLYASRHAGGKRRNALTMGQEYHVSGDKTTVSR
jgi:hypothetical protein